MSSTAEAELGALLHQTLAELGIPQPCTPMQTNNATAHMLLTKKILPKALKAMDMHFHWLRCRNAQGQFCYYWRPSTQYLADYFTKHHPTIHHTSVCPTILTPINNPKDTKLFETITTSVTFEQIRTLVSTKMFVKNLLQTPRFKTTTINTVTATSP
jgi:hypothetical protein